jgi:hypothetical protein
MFKNSTHCQYRGCMNPLPEHAIKGVDHKWYCDSMCAGRGEHFAKRQDDQWTAHVLALTSKTY